MRPTGGLSPSELGTPAEAPVPRSAGVVVVGGGLAGLSAALHLAERGLRPLVLEADARFVGGRVAGGDRVDVGGWTFRGDHGVHAVWSPYRNLQAMLARHGLRPVLAPADDEEWLYKRHDWVRRAAVGGAIRRSWLPAPFHYLALFFRPRFLGMLDLDELLGALPVWGGLMWALGVDPLREGQPLEGLWLSDLVHGWTPALRSLFIGLTRNGLAALPEEIPLSGFIAFLRYYTLLRRDAWAFAYLPRDGGTSLAEPLAGRVRELGGALRLGVRAVRLEPAGGGWLVHWQRGEEMGHSAARQVVLAMDAPNTAALLAAGGPDPSKLGTPSETPGPGRGLYWPRGMATAVVRFWFDRAPRPGPEAGMLSGDFVPDNFFWLHRIQDDHIRWHRATGGSSIEVHIYGPPAVLDEPDALLLARVAADVHSAFPELRGHQLHHELRRNPPTHTLLSVGPADRHLGIETPWPGVYCCGDWVRHPSPAFFMERACVTGIEAANAVLRARGLPGWRLLDPPEPEWLAGRLERLMLRGRRALRRRRARP